MVQELSKSEMGKLLKSNVIGHLAYVQGNTPYVVPITYYYDEDSHALISYTSEGHKLTTMRSNGLLALCVTEINAMKEWRSVVAHGSFEELTGSTAKHTLRTFYRGILENLADRKEGSQNFLEDLSAHTKDDNIPVVYRINIQELTGKCRLDL